MPVADYGVDHPAPVEAPAKVAIFPPIFTEHPRPDGIEEISKVIGTPDSVL